MAVYYDRSCNNYIIKDLIIDKLMIFMIAKVANSESEISKGIQLITIIISIQCIVYII